ncbi:MAG TPA: DUF2147 domain-containing protein [Candidatus Hydrogenedentes bacterium]|nr:DUF2147 domain-containing protein [Candidatus Hydrogenedentota bacterium]
MLSSVFHVIGIAIAAAGAAGDGDAILGHEWLTKDGGARFAFTKRDGKYYGHICWEKDSVYDKKDQEAGKPTRDRNNPDPALRNRPMLGLEILKDFEYQGENRYESGTIYNPEDGRTYKAKLTLADPDHLKVRGFIGISLLGGTTVWTRWSPGDDEKTPVPGESADPPAKSK